MLIGLVDDMTHIDFGFTDTELYIHTRTLFETQIVEWFETIKTANV